MNPTIRERIAAFLSPVPVPVSIMVPTEFEKWAAPYIAAGWAVSLTCFPQYGGAWNAKIFQETKTSGCETITCEHRECKKTAVEATAAIDALGVLPLPEVPRG